MASAFPSDLGEHALRLAAALPASDLAPAEAFEVSVSGQTIAIPYRIYCSEPPSSALADDSLTQAMAHCLFTRHSDGQTRQRHLAYLLASQTPWSVPFVVQLAGEYVIEIVEEILRGTRNWDGRDRDLVADFLSQNPTYFRRTQSRVVSYWNCYHRDRWPLLSEFPGQVLMRELAAMLNASADSQR